MQFMGFNYDEKSYFSDRHEDEQNKEDRKKCIKKYFDFEKRMYRWVQIKEELPKKYKEEEEGLLKNIYYEYLKNNVKMREYHVDTYHKFNNFNKTMSVRSDPNSRPIMIIGQDESCF